MVNIIKKAFEYFNTSDMGELEETDGTVTRESKPIGRPLPKREDIRHSSQKNLVKSKVSKTVSSHPKVSIQGQSVSQQSVSPAVSHPTASINQSTSLSKPSTPFTETRATQQMSIWSRERVQAHIPPLPKAPTERPNQQVREEQAPALAIAGNEEKSVRITIKYPQRYEDAPAIVDLLIEHETILIDFEYMDEGQARRCIDFLDGASRVLAGSLQRVGGSLYLLAPKHVVVTAEELRQVSNKPELSYDYDMKRR